MNNIEKLIAMTNWEIEAIIAKEFLGWQHANGHNGYGTAPDGTIGTLPPMCSDLNIIAATVREWSHKNLVRQDRFQSALDRILRENEISASFYRLINATARDISIALVMVAQEVGYADKN